MCCFANAHQISRRTHAGQHVKCGLFAPVPGGPTDQAAAPGLHHSNSAVDVRPVVQGAALRVPANRHAVLHLCDHRHAGMFDAKSHTHIYAHMKHIISR